MQTLKRVNTRYEDYLEGTYKLLVEQSRPRPNGDYNSFKNQHLCLYGYDDFIGANKLIPMKEYIGFGGTINVERPNMPMYYYMTDFVYRNNIITEPYWVHSITHHCSDPNGFLHAGIRGYVAAEDTNTSLSIGIPPSGNPNACSATPLEDETRTMQGLPQASYVSSVSDAYIDKFLYFPRQSYKFVVLTPSRASNLYDTEIGEIELNEPGRGEPWFDSEQVCIVFDECFISPPLESYEPTFDIRGVADEMLKRDHASFSMFDAKKTCVSKHPFILLTMEGSITCLLPIL
jgi:hypothetical protein